MTSNRELVWYLQKLPTVSGAFARGILIHGCREAHSGAIRRGFIQQCINGDPLYWELSREGHQFLRQLEGEF